MSKYRITVKVDSNAGDIMRLPCVYAAYKTPATGEITYELYPDKEGVKHYANSGDYIRMNNANDYSVLKHNIYNI